MGRRTNRKKKRDAGPKADMAGEEESVPLETTQTYPGKRGLSASRRNKSDQTKTGFPETDTFENITGAGWHDTRAEKIAFIMMSVIERPKLGEKILTFLK